MANQNSGEFKYVAGKVFDARWIAQGPKLRLEVAMETHDPDTGEDITVKYFMHFSHFNATTGATEPISDEQYGYRLRDFDTLGASKDAVKAVTRETPREKVAAIFPKTVRLKMGKNDNGYWEIKGIFDQRRTIRVADDQVPAAKSVLSAFDRSDPVARPAASVKPGDEEIPF